MWTSSGCNSQCHNGGWILAMYNEEHSKHFFIPWQTLHVKLDTEHIRMYVGGCLRTMSVAIESLHCSCDHFLWTHSFKQIADSRCTDSSGGVWWRMVMYLGCSSTLGISLEQVTMFILPFAATVTLNVEIHWAQDVMKKMRLQCHSKTSFIPWAVDDIDQSQNTENIQEFIEEQMVTPFDAISNLDSAPLNTSELQWSIEAETRERNAIWFGLRIAFQLVQIRKHIWVADKITYYSQWTWPKWVVPCLSRRVVLPCFV